MSCSQLNTSIGRVNCQPQTSVVRAKFKSLAKYYFPHSIPFGDDSPPIRTMNYFQSEHLQVWLNCSIFVRELPYTTAKACKNIHIHFKSPSAPSAQASRNPFRLLLHIGFKRWHTSEQLNQCTSSFHCAQLCAKGVSDGVQTRWLMTLVESILSTDIKL